MPVISCSTTASTAPRRRATSRSRRNCSHTRIAVTAADTSASTTASAASGTE